MDASATFSFRNVTIGHRQDPDYLTRRIEDMNYLPNQALRISLKDPRHRLCFVEHYDHRTQRLLRVHFGELVGDPSDLR